MAKFWANCSFGPGGLFTPENNFGAGSASRQIIELPATALKAGEVKSPGPLSDYAEWRARCSGNKAFECVFVFSAFSGGELARQFAEAGAESIAVVGPFSPVDEAHLGSARALHLDVADPGDMDRIRQALPADERPALFILDGVLERLLDPRPLLRALRMALRQNAGNLLVIRTTNRDAPDSLDPVGVPTDATCVRIWSGDELANALEHAGFQPQPRTTSGTSPAAEPASFEIVLRCDAETYAGFLKARRLPQAADHLILTTEHAEAYRTGGIGTYHQQVGHSTGLERIVLFTGMFGLQPDWQEDALRHGWLHVAHLLGDRSGIESRPDQNHEDLILLAALQAVFLYDSIRVIEFQDYLGIGVRIAQAKRTGLLPPSVTVFTYGHGTHFYLDHAAGEISTTRDLRLDALERLCLENSDVVVFPSVFLRDLYVVQQGLQLRSIEMQGYPISVSRGEPGKLERQPVKRLVFYGKQTVQKGYPDFCDAVCEIFSNPSYAEAAASIKHVVLMGVEAPDKRLLGLKDVEVSSGSWSRQQAVDMLHDYGNDSIVVLPYRGDNHPLSVSEVIQADCQIMAYAAGGLPEILPKSLHDRVLCKPGSRPLAAALAREITEPLDDRIALIAKARELVADQYDANIVSYRAMVERLKTRGDLTAPARQAVTVIVPNYNGDPRYIKDVAEGLRHSSWQPAEVIVIDDGSTPENFALANASLAAFAPLPARIIQNLENLGLAATRNNGLAQVKTPYVCAHDNDNIISNAFLDIACRILDTHPEIAAVTTWLTGFMDGDDWRLYEPHAYRYRPLGADLSLGLVDNEFGDALAVYRVDALKRVGGWDGTSRALWEDWQLFIRMTALGEKIVVLPREMFCYRVRADSMARTYNKFFGFMRLARAIPGLPLADANGLVRALARRKQTGPNMEFAALAQPPVRPERPNALQGRDMAPVYEPTPMPVEPGDRVPGTQRGSWLGNAVQAMIGKIRPPAISPEELMLSRSRYFNAEWYLQQYASEMGAEKNPYRHYMKFGNTGEFDPGPSFSSRAYLRMYIDVADSGSNPLLHYVRHGVSEGRRIVPSSRSQG